jgi:cation:H+ antiporter
LVIEALILIAISLPLLYYGASWLVDNAAEAGRRAGVSSLLIGLTVVAFGTSAPELAVSLFASASHESALAVGNVMGSNVFNIGVVMATGAILAPIAVRAKSLRPHAVTLLLSALLFLGLSIDGSLTFVDGLVLLAAFAGVLVLAYNRGKTPVMAEAIAEEKPLKEAPRRSGGRVAGGIVAGLVLLVLGAQALVTGAVDLATAAGVDARTIGLTVVAAGTSLPELATTVVASRKKQDDIAVGNVVGSNFFNIAAILGVSALVSPLPVGGPVLVDFAVMLGFTVAMLAFMRTGSRVTRREGAALLAAYLVYLAWLVLAR